MFGFIKKIFGIEDVDVAGILEQGAVIIDVRTPDEYKSGHPRNSINIPLQQINSKISKIRKYNKPVLTCCASGRRSGMAANMLKAKGIDAYNGGSWSSVARALDRQKTQTI